MLLLGVVSGSDDLHHHAYNICTLRAQALISVAGVSDFVASNELVSKAIAMVAEEQELNVILSELLSATDNETYVRSVCLYAEPGDELSFWDIAARARRRNEVVIGYTCGGGVFLNPNDKHVLRKWQRSDTVSMQKSLYVHSHASDPYLTRLSHCLLEQIVVLADE